MIPFQSQLIAGAVALAVGFGAGFKVQSWRWDASLAAQERERAALAVKSTTDLMNAAKAQEYIATTYEQEKARAKLKTDAVISGLRNRSVVLRDPAPIVPACPSAPAATGVSDGTALAKLPDPAAGTISVESSEFLIGLVTDADSIVAQLTACQAIVRADRK